MRVVCVAGARPNFMKVKPVMAALEAGGAEVVLVHTGQHYDDAMSEVFLTELGIRTPDHSLGVGSGTHAEQTGRVMAAFEPLVAEVAPEVVVVVGDVNSVADSIRLVDPVGYLDFVALQAGARVVLTDSGGVQEETTVLGVPCLTLRDTTERPITVTHGTNTVVGMDPERIVAEARRVLRDGVEPRCPPLWDGRAGERIASVLLDGAGGPGRRRPTARP